MNTPSHLIINAALSKALHRVPMQRSAFLFGAVMPDIPFFLLTIGGFIYYRFIQGQEVSVIMAYMFNQLYFHDPLWISAHNLLHSPTLLLLGLAALWRFRDRSDSRLRWGFWFLAGCLVHTALDIPTHVNDGPLLFFPFEWTLRFTSPVSYWDDTYFGREFAIFEMALNGVLLLYLFAPMLWRLMRRESDSLRPEA